VMDILAQAGVRPTTVIVTQGKKLLTKDHRVEDGRRSTSSPSSPGLTNR